ISSDGGKRKRPEDEEELVEAVFSDNDEEQGEKSDEITDQPSKPIAKHVPGRQNFHTSQIPGPSINYASNPQNILPCDAQNNIQNMCSQHNLSVQTYSSFQQNSSAHREFQKVFLKTDFGH
ncbi:hypothetical protein PV326_001505, partial [Microctonus aethiopoides]